MFVFYFDAEYFKKHIGPVNKEAPVYAVKEGEKGYWPIYTLQTAANLNRLNMTEDVLFSALSASMFGWDTPIANEARAYIKTPKGC